MIPTPRSCEQPAVVDKWARLVHGTAVVCRASAGGDFGEVGEQLRCMAQTARKHQHTHMGHYVQGTLATGSMPAAFRQRCVNWVYEVAQSVHLDKHGAWCAVAILDAFLSSTADGEAEAGFQRNAKLTSLCALVISSKFNGCGNKITPAVAAHFSAGLFPLNTILQHERDVMGELSWDVNFVSPYEAARFLVLHVVPAAQAAVLAEVAEKVIDVARAEPSVIGTSAAVFACAAVHIALQHYETAELQSCQLRLSVLAISAGISTGDVQGCTSQLDGLLGQNDEDRAVSTAAVQDQQPSAARVPATGAAVAVPEQPRHPETSESPTGIVSLELGTDGDGCKSMQRQGQKRARAREPGPERDHMPEPRKWQPPTGPAATVQPIVIQQYGE